MLLSHWIIGTINCIWTGYITIARSNRSTLLTYSNCSGLVYTRMILMISTLYLGWYGKIIFSQSRDLDRLVRSQCNVLTDRCTETIVDIDCINWFVYHCNSCHCSSHAFIAFLRCCLHHSSCSRLSSSIWVVREESLCSWCMLVHVGACYILNFVD